MESKISAPTRVEEILAEWNLDDKLTHSTGLYESAQGTGYESVYHLGTDTISITDTLNNMSVTSPYTVTGAIGTSFSNTLWTTAGTTTAPWLSSNPTGAKIQLDGEAADITVNGWSLVDAVKRIEQRLGLYQPNPELESEWTELRELGEQYKKLEQHIQDKQATWDKLKAMPAPEVD